MQPFSQACIRDAAYEGPATITATGQGVARVHLAKHDTTGALLWDDVELAGGEYAISGVKMRYYPYGQEVGTATANDVAKFGTYTRDATSGLDYAMNRYYMSTWGRFTTADPYRASGGPGDPGSWNRYSYVGGDPVNYNDASGQLGCWVSNWLSNAGEHWGHVVCFSDNHLWSNSGWYTAPSVSSAAEQALIVQAQEDWDYLDAADGLKTVRGGLRDISRMDLSKCQDVLERIAGTSLAVIQGQARMSAGFVYDGTQSPVLWNSEMFTDERPDGWTIANEFNKGIILPIVALSQENGPAIYVNPAYFEPGFRGRFFKRVDRRGNLTSFGLGTLLHEVLHKFADHARMVQSLGIAHEAALEGPIAISRAIASRCF